MSRHTAREHLFKMTFEYLFNKEKNDATLNAYLMDATLTDGDKQYLTQVYDGVISHFDELTSLIAQFATGYTLDRIYKPDLAAMLVSAYELKYMQDTIPSAVSVNEAVDTVKRYSTEKSRSFVNGVLASIIKELAKEKPE